MSKSRSAYGRTWARKATVQNDVSRAARALPPPAATSGGGRMFGGADLLDRRAKSTVAEELSETAEVGEHRGGGVVVDHDPASHDSLREDRPRHSRNVGGVAGVAVLQEPEDGAVEPLGLEAAHHRPLKDDRLGFAGLTRIGTDLGLLFGSEAAGLGPALGDPVVLRLCDHPTHPLMDAE